MKAIYMKLLFLLLILPTSLLAQKTLTGTVLENASGQPLPGVNIVIQGNSTGVSIDFDGKFLLSGVNNGDVVVFSFIGYKDFTVAYQGQASVNVTMEEEANQLSEVVIQVGYGTVRKKDATGSVTTVTEKDFNKGPVVSVDQMIQGKVAGLQITNGGGAPGEGATIRIRSGSSLTANNDPLYVVDGVPLAPGGVTGGRNPLATINQNNIESVTVLKDASATAIYGNRASNGVIIITTKKGKSGEMKISYNGNVSASEIYDYVDVLSTEQFRDYVTQNGFVNQDNVPVQANLMGAASTDWQKEIYTTAISTDHNVSLSGGVDALVYRVSIGATEANGLLERDRMSRSTIGGGFVGNFFDKHLKIELNSNTSTMRNDYSNRGAIGSAVGFDPTQSVFDANGEYFQWINSNANNSLAPRNPLSLIRQTNNYGNSFRSINNIQFDYKLHFFEDLRAVANFGMDDQVGRSYGDTSIDFAYVGAGNRYDSRQKRKNKLMDLYLNYRKDITSIKTIVDVTGGYSYQDFRDETQGFSFDSGSGLLTPGLVIPNRINLQSLFARTNITINDKYLITLSLRRDGTSRFTEDNRWGNFPAVALAWKINEEGIFKNVTTLSNLKLRLGWGITGQQDIGVVYPSIPLYLSADQGAQYQFGNQFITPFRPQPYNPNLKWEETETQNIGLDFGFYKNRFNGSIDVYRRETKDLLLYIFNPPFFGFSNADNYNIGNLENKGIELSAEVIPFKTEDFTWILGGNITFQDSKVTKLITEDDSTNGIDTGGYQGGVGNTIQNLQLGYEPNTYLVFEQAYDAAGNPLDGVYVDRNNDGVINANDQYRYKKPASDVFYGFNTSVMYKNFDMSMAWRGSWGNYNYNNVDSAFGTANTVLLNETAAYLGNGVTNLLETGFTNSRFESDYYIQDASYLKLDNVTLGYNVKRPTKATTNYRLTISGQNLLIITDYKGIDPEIANGIDGNIYPRPITFTLGLNVNF